MYTPPSQLFRHAHKPFMRSSPQGLFATARQVAVDMKYCGVCHSDMHFARGDLMNMAGLIPISTVYPMVPGHELAGVVSAVGAKVTKFKLGDQIGIGCFVDACLKCKNCRAGRDNYCMEAVLTYHCKIEGKLAKRGRAGLGPGAPPWTLGGYSTKMVVHERFATPVPPSYPLKYVGPMMCAGVTMWSPLRQFNITEGSKVAVVGLGGLGMLGIQLAKALGAEVTAISRTDKKKALAEKLGATRYVVSSDERAMAADGKRFDLIMNTIPSYPNWRLYHPLVGKGGNQCLLGISADQFPATMMTQFMGLKRSLTGSGIGSIKESIELIAFAEEHQIYPEVELFEAKKLNEIYTRLDQNVDGVRYVMETETINPDVDAGKPPTISPTPKKKGDVIRPRNVFPKLLWYLCCGPGKK
jgi:uncharacterized zinc-type alcohol dehydrogenase-like protein